MGEELIRPDIGQNPEFSIPPDPANDINFKTEGSIATDPTKQDTIVKFQMIDKQNIRLNGTVSFVDDGITVNFSLNPKMPSLDSPDDIDRENMAYSDSGLEVTIKDVNGEISLEIKNSGHIPNELTSANPWFTPSFLSAFTAIMNEVLKMHSKTRYQESLAEMKGTKATLAMAKDNAALTKELYNLQAQEKMTEAMSAFTGAAIAGVTMVQSFRTTSMAQKDPKVKKLNQQIKDNKAERTALKNEATAGNNPAVTQAHADKIAANKAQSQKLKDERKTVINATITRLDDRNRYTNQMLSGMNEGVKNLLLASLKWEQGDVDALKQINEGLIQVLRTYTENSAKFRDIAQSSYDEAIRNLEKIVDSVYKAHYIGQGA